MAFDFDSRQQAHRDALIARDKAQRKAQRDEDTARARLAAHPPLPVVEHPAARCPGCHSAELKSYHSTEDDGVRTKYTKCKVCGSKFILLIV